VEEFTTRMTLADLVKPQDELLLKTRAIASENVETLRKEELRS
jgi:hypothetical protein